MAKSWLLQAYKKAVGSVSFSAELRKLRRELNAKIDTPQTIDSLLTFHPSGVNRWFKRRRISIAEAYLTLIGNLDAKSSKTRLEALKVLVEASFHSKSLDFPLNTARVQAALVKEAVKSRHNKRRQLELLYDFSRSTGGQHQVIRKLCDELNIVELPEAGNRLADFEYGWDDHVHDTATSGRKNATQLLLDAFIKGISRLTIAYGSAGDREMMEEAFDAGAILGIGVSIGLEFSMAVEGKRYHFMAILPDFASSSEIGEFFSRQEDALGTFFRGLESNQQARLESVGRLLSQFNAGPLRALNSGWPEASPYQVGDLSMEDLYTFIPTASINRLHLAEFLFVKLKPVLLARLQLLKVRKSSAKHRLALGLATAAEAKEAESAYSAMKKEYKELNPEILLERYFSGPRIIDYQSVFEDIEEASSALRRAGCRLKLLQPLEYGLEAAVGLLDRWWRNLDIVELYNTQDCIARPESEILELARALNRLNALAEGEGSPPVVPVCGSDSTGRNPSIPGMGFIFEDCIAGKMKKAYIGRHLLLPGLVSDMIRAKGKPVDEAAARSGSKIVCLGKVSGGYYAASAEEPSGDSAFIPLDRALRYLNPAIRNGFFAAVGFFVAQRFVGPWYALLWLGITGFRNSIADLVASRGARLSEWKLRSINFDNVAQSLFWTGFSVPILNGVKIGFDALWPWQAEGLGFNLAKFFFISFANGLYLASHNTLRGFDRSVVRANFFRSVLSWPLATVFAPLGSLIGIPSIVQTKIWSDVVAGFIEGGSKYVKVLRLRHRNLAEIVPDIIDGTGSERLSSILDLVYLFKEEPRTRTSLAAIFHPERKRIVKAPESPGLPAKALTDLRAVLEDPGLGERLADFALTSYEEEIAVDLVDLVAENLPALQDWLADQAKLA
ncbi:MAG TPA: hypothetical protein VIO60_05780 [Rectinemataceae bacterium]